MGTDKRKIWEIFDEIVKKAIEFEIFDRRMFEEYSILTSASIQETYLEAKKKSVPKIDERYLLLNDAKNRINSEKTQVNSTETPINSAIMPQSKVKESKVKYSKAEKSNADDPAITALRKYEQLIGVATPTVIEGTDFYIKEGVESDLIIRLIEYACEQGKRTWSYIQASIRGNMDAGIKTIDAYNRAQAKRAETAKKVRWRQATKSKFNNYVDDNKPDYSDFGQKVLDDLLRESEG